MSYTSLDYNKLSQIYDSSRVANTETTGKLLRLLDINGDSVVLDMGCGTGNYTAALEQVANRVIGIDKSLGMIKRAHIKFPELSFVCGDVTSIPIGSESIDAAFAIQVLHHVKDKEKFCNEAYRVLRNLGYVAVHACSHRQIRAFWFFHYFPKGLQIDLERSPDCDEIKYLLDRAGFSGIHYEVCYTDAVVTNETPEQYLDKDYRDSISTFSFLTEEEIEEGCEKIRKDIDLGAIEDIVERSNIKVANEVGGVCIIYGRKVI